MPTIKAATNKLLRADSCSSAEFRKSLIEENKATEQQPLPVGRRTRRITFFEQVAVRETEHIRDYTSEEIANSWYSKPEYRMMRRDIIATVNLIVRGVQVDTEEEYCTRGVEFRTPQGSHRRKHRKLHSMLAVFDEQAEQELAGTAPQPEALSLVYSRASATCREEAANKGKLDAVDAARIHGGHDNLTPELLRKFNKRGKKL